MSRAGNLYSFWYYKNGVLVQALFHSDGEGATWTQCALGGVTPLPAYNTYSVLLASGGYIFAGLGGNGPLWRSSDQGATFAPCYPSDAAAGRCCALAEKPGNPGTLGFLGAYNRYWITHDYGGTWGPNPVTPFYVTIPWTVIHLYWPYAGRLYALGTGGIATSGDDGTTWTLLRYQNNTPGGQIVVLYFPADPSKPPWGASATGLLWRGQMVSGAWNGCFEGETPGVPVPPVTLPPTPPTAPTGTPTNFNPLSINNAPYCLFHPSRLVVLGLSTVSAEALYKSYVHPDPTNRINLHGWTAGQKVRYRRKTRPVPTNVVNIGTDVITITAHGYADGERVQYRAINTPVLGGLADEGWYYIKLLTADTFSLSLTAGGVTIDLTGTGNGSQTLSGAQLAPLVDGHDYFVLYVDANNIQLALTSGGTAIVLTSTGNDSQTLGVLQGGIITTPIAYASAGTPVWTYPELDSGMDFDHGVIDPNNSAYIWAMKGSLDGNSSNLGGVYRSLDGGLTWAPSNAGIDRLSGNANIYGAPLIVTDGTPHDSVPVPPSAPVITAVTDLDPYTFSGLSVTYTAGQAALTHDLYVDGVLAVSGYASSATYHPADRQPHSYVVRATNAAGHTDSNAVTGADLSVPALTSIADANCCAQSGIKVYYTGDPAALSHDLVRDSVVVVAGYVSGTLYNPGDETAHTYLIRANYSGSTADSNTLAFSDADNTPGAPVITGIVDIDPYSQSGVMVNFTAGVGATSHDLYVDGVLAVTGYVSGAAYAPGNDASHAYVVRAKTGSCYTDSTPMSAVDNGLPPPPAPDSGCFTLCFDIPAKAWHVWQGGNASGHYWNPVQKEMRAWGPTQCGSLKQRGGQVDISLYVALMGIANPDRLKRFRHVEIDLTADTADWTCEFVVDGATRGTVTKALPNRGWWTFGLVVAGWVSRFGAAASTGTFARPKRQTLRFPCPQGGLGKVVGMQLSASSHGAFRLHAVTLSTEEA